MKTFLGTKRIQARPMNRLEYNEYRGWELPADENGADEGYLVEYAGDNSNHPNHDGYISWSPKKQFEESYIEDVCLDGEVTSELPHQQRVIAEATDLKDKITKLHDFINGNSIFNGLDSAEQNRLRLQLTCMDAYYSVLVERINNF